MFFASSCQLANQKQDRIALKLRLLVARPLPWPGKSATPRPALRPQTGPSIVGISLQNISARDMQLRWRPLPRGKTSVRSGRSDQGLAATKANKSDTACRTSEKPADGSGKAHS